jgi:hypothetical protein
MDGTVRSAKTRDGRTTTAIQPTSTGPTKVDSARAIVVVRSKIRNNSAIVPKRGLNLYRLNSAKNTTTIRPVTVNHASASYENFPMTSYHRLLMSVTLRPTLNSKYAELATE